MSDFIRLTQRAPPGVADLATAYIYGIATSDEFPDGNNRTVWVVDLMFLAFSEVDAINFMLAAADNMMGQQAADGTRQHLVTA